MNSLIAPQAIEIAQNELVSRFARGFSVKEARASYADRQPAQAEGRRLTAARRRVAFASHRRVEVSTRGDKVFRTRA